MTQSKATCETYTNHLWRGWEERGCTVKMLKGAADDVLVAQLYLILCNPMDYSLPGSSVHGILQSRILEWVAIPFSRGSSLPLDRTQDSCTAGRFFTVWDMRALKSQGRAPEGWRGGQHLSPCLDISSTACQVFSNCLSHSPQRIKRKRKNLNFHIVKPDLGSWTEDMSHTSKKQRKTNKNVKLFQD